MRSLIRCQDLLLKIFSVGSLGTLTSRRHSPSPRKDPCLHFTALGITASQRALSSSMHSPRGHKLREALHHAFQILEDMALDPRLYRSLTSSFESSASAPSLRASEPATWMAPSHAADDAGNVKVVVRVRGFVKRGKTATNIMSIHNCNI
jgi:hypothetical protein